MEKPILIQGAMNEETEVLICNIKNIEEKIINGYHFFCGTIGDTKVVISNTKIGSINAAVATILGIINFNPLFVINQGIAGGHSREIHRGDIIVGKCAININSYETDALNEGEGVNTNNWKIVSFTEENNIEKEKIYANETLVNNLYSMLKDYTDIKIHLGTIASGDCWNREIDRINWYVEQLDSKCEDMESYSSYKICKENNIPVIGIRIISNSQINFEEYDASVATILQDRIIKLIFKSGRVYENI